MSLDLSAPIREAIIAQDPITSKLAQWQGEPAVFTRRPIPGDAQSIFIVVNPNAAVADQDGLTSRRPVVIRDVAIYGEQKEDYRDVEEIGYLIRELFHRRRLALDVPGYSVTSIECSGPFAGPVDDDKDVCRIVSLEIALRALP